MKTDKQLNSRNTESIPVGVIGIGCFFPKASGLKEYWRLLFHGEDAITDVPKTHWNAEDYYHQDPKKPDHVYCTRGGFLSPVPFDPSEFGIPPSSLEATDTSQLLGLVAAKLALEDAGYGDGREFDRDRASVILGVTGTQELVIPLGARLGHPIWKKSLLDSGVSPEKAEEVMKRISDSYVPWQENSFPGLLGNVVAGRICNRLNFGGTNCVVDAACASSMSAVHMALMELMSGRSDMVVTGGVDALNDIFMHMCFSRTGILSPTGDIRPFSKDADGTVLGEGIGMIILKRLEDAEKDGDRIYAVIRGMGTSSDGKSQSIYAPRPEGQAKALKGGYLAAGVAPETVGMIESHGTGTRVGDAVEFKSLMSVFQGSHRNGNRIALGSVKSNIGHTKAAAGAAGLIKTVLSLYHKVLLPTIKADDPDPNLNIGNSPFYLNTRARPWFSAPDHPRRAGVSSFGFGGSNYHVVLEEYRPDKSEISWDGVTDIIAVSGQTRQSVLDELDAFDSVQASDRSKQALSVYAHKTRQSFQAADPHRLLMILDYSDPSPDYPAQLIRNARNLIRSGVKPASDDVFYGTSEAPGKIAFVFPGQGSQYIGMGKDLVCTFPEAFETAEAANRAWMKNEPGRLSDLIYPYPALTEADRRRQEMLLQRTDHAQPAIGCVSMAMLNVLKSFGVTPDAVCGHSYGELTALCAAGRIQPEDFFYLSVIRGKLMAENREQNTEDGEPEGGSPTSGMTAVFAPLDEIDRIIEKESPDVTVANRNSPKQGVLSGALPAVEKAEAVFKSKGYKTKRLPVSAAFHSDQMAHVRQPFSEALESVPITPASAPVFSNTTGKPYPPEPDAVRRLLADHLLKPVDFINEIRSMVDSGVRTFVEVGPKSILTGLIKSILSESGHQSALQKMSGLFHAVAMDYSAGRRYGFADLAVVLCILASLGYPVDIGHWENPVSDRQQRMSIPISGANYRSDKKTPVKPDRAGIPSDHLSAAPVSVAASAPVQTGRSEQIVKKENISSPVISREKESLAYKGDYQRMKSDDQTSIPALNPENSPHVSGMIKAVQEGLKSIQALQMQTADAHKKFLETQSEASRTLQQMMAHTRDLTELSMGRGQRTPGLQVEAPEFRISEFQTESRRTEDGEQRVRIPYSEKTTAQVRSGITGQNANTEAAVPEPQTGRLTAEDRKQKTEHIRPSAPITPSGPPPGAEEASKTDSVLLGIVSELTGYPLEMLSLNQDIEADLGIDSIKRVEILSMMEERMPGLPPVSPEQMGTLKTLGQIADFLKGGAKDDFRTPEVNSPVPAKNNFHAPENQKIESVLLAVVSGLTGYPVEMLSLNQDIEADLGIDSIKRVEILSMLEEKLPGLPSVSPDMIGTLKTLGHIADFLAGGGPSIQHDDLNKTSPVISEISAVADSAKSDDLEKTVLAIVCELTGYPAEMLSKDQDMESDLGIDSIKRVEILSRLEELMPGLPQITPDMMGTLKTLGQIISFLSGGSGQTADLSDTVQRQIVVLNEHPFQAGKRIVFPPDRTVYVTEESSGLSRAIAEAFRANDIPSRLIPLSSSGSQMTKPAGLVIVPDLNDGAGWNDAFIKDAFHLTKSVVEELHRSGKENGAVFGTVTRMDGTFGFDASSKDIRSPLQGALAGLTKTAAAEWHDVSCRALDIDPAWNDYTAIADLAVKELIHEGPAEVGFTPGHRYVPALVSCGYPDGKLNLSSQDVIAVTGGARGVTAAAAQALADQMRLVFVLFGRSQYPLPEPEWLRNITEESAMKKAILQHEFKHGSVSPQKLESVFRTYRAAREIAETLEVLRSKGSAAHYYAADIRDEEKVRTALNQVRSAFGPVRAVIHGAGVLEDKFIADKTADQFSKVFDTKVRGLKTLLDATAGDDLKYLVLFSSVSARIGNKGQADYAMANEALNKIARRESFLRPDCRVISVNWGPWDGGMVHPALKREFERVGMSLIPIRSGATSMVREMMRPSGEPAEVVLGTVFSFSKDRKSETNTPDAGMVQNTADFSVAIRRDIDLERLPIADSLITDGKPSAPFALLTEWLGQVALHGNPGLFLQGLDDIRLNQIIKIDSEPIPIRLLAGKPRKVTNPSETGNGTRYEVQVEIRDGFKAPHEIIHSQARAILTDEIPAPALFDHAMLKTDAPYSGNMQDIYKRMLFHGDGLKGIQEIKRLTPESVVAKITGAPPPSEWMTEPLRTRWIGDPLVIESAFQMAGIWAYDQKRQTAVPHYCESYRQYCSKFPSDGVTAVFEIVNAADDVLIGNFTFLDAQHRIVARLSGYKALMTPVIS